MRLSSVRYGLDDVLLRCLLLLLGLEILVDPMIGLSRSSEIDQGGQSANPSSIRPVTGHLCCALSSVICDLSFQHRVVLPSSLSIHLIKTILIQNLLDLLSQVNTMIEVICNDRLGKKVRVKCNEDDTIGDLKKLIAAQVGTRPEKIR